MMAVMRLDGFDEIIMFGILLFSAGERVFFFRGLGRWFGLFFTLNFVGLNFSVDFVWFARKE